MIFLLSHLRKSPYYELKYKCRGGQPSNRTPSAPSVLSPDPTIDSPLPESNHPADSCCHNFLVFPFSFIVWPQFSRHASVVFSMLKSRHVFWVPVPLQVHFSSVSFPYTLFWEELGAHGLWSSLQSGMCCLHTRNAVQQFSGHFFACKFLAGPRSLTWLGLIWVDLFGKFVGGKHITSVSLLLTLVIIDARCLDSSIHQRLQNGDFPSFIFYVFVGIL